MCINGDDTALYVQWTQRKGRHGQMTLQSGQTKATATLVLVRGCMLRRLDRMCACEKVTQRGPSWASKQLDDRAVTFGKPRVVPSFFLCVIGGNTWLDPESVGPLDPRREGTQGTDSRTMCQQQGMGKGRIGAVLQWLSGQQETRAWQTADDALEAGGQRATGRKRALEASRGCWVAILAVRGRNRRRAKEGLRRIHKYPGT